MRQIIAAVDIFVGFRPASGETIPGGWIIATGYFALSWLCRCTGRQELRLREIGFERLRPRFWLFISYCFVFLGINQLLGIENWLTILGRKVAASEGWYDLRRPVQIAFISVICLNGLAILSAGLIYTRDQWSRYTLAWLGTVALISFAAIRAVSFHFIDLFLNHRWGIISINRICELSGLIIVALGVRKASWFYLRTDLTSMGSASDYPRSTNRAEFCSLVRKFHGGIRVKNR